MSTYAHLTDAELVSRVVMNGEGDTLHRELALRLEARVDELDDLRIAVASETAACAECGARI